MIVSMLQQVFARSPRMVSRRIAGECVLVPLAAKGADLDSIYNLNVVAAFIWERLDGRTAGDAIVAALSEAFEVDRDTAARDFAAFVETLQSLGALIELGDAASHPPDPPATRRE